MHARQILAGVAGMSTVPLPLAGSASSIASMIAASEPVVPDSPAPLMPRGFVAAGKGHETAYIGGTSHARGMA
jgi:hypothetical protein